jgi:hypothetical protein
MLQQIIELCTSPTGIYWLLLGSDISIAVAYFAIPITMAVVLRDRRDDIPYPWLWTLFVTFIVACGLTHVAHVLSAAAGPDHMWLLAVVSVFCAVASVGTAVAFAFILPQIRLLPSPVQQRAELERLVTQRTLEKDQLIREINHRIGNQLQIIGSIISIEARKAEGEETHASLQRLRTEVDKMAREHVERSRADYLEHDVRQADGSPPVASAPENLSIGAQAAAGAAISTG